MSSLLLLRHGQASFGADRYDALSDRGRLQSDAVGGFFAARQARFSSIWIGPRERHRLTARAALTPLGVAEPQDVEPALDEFAEGQQILASAERRQGLRLRGVGALTGVPVNRAYAAEIDAWAEGRAEIEQVPSVARFRAGVADWLSRATADPASGQQVLAVTSGGVIAAVMAIVLDLPDASLGPFMNAIHNASLTELAFSSGRRPALVAFNGSGHLPADLLTRI